MRKTLLIFMLCMAVTTFAQKGITFSVEELSKPNKLLNLQSSNDILEYLIHSDKDISYYDIKHRNIDFDPNIIAKSNLPDSMVYLYNHPFFNGMYEAYADHRPFVLSPDMVWLLICQGFARHVNANAETLRPYFVNHSGKLSLIVASDKIALDNPDSPWEEIFPQFTKQMKDYVGKELIDILSNNFSTTTPVERIASEITIMEAMKPYFDFIVMRVVCGIPEITLQGTTKDWQKVLDKARKLRKYELDWWIDEIEPILEEFVKASKGNINKDFWRNMFKYHTSKIYGVPKIIDGWIVKFFPYSDGNKRNDLKEIGRIDKLPDEMVKTDIKYIDTETGEITMLELWAGFVGLEQNTENYALTPKIGWMIRIKDPESQNRDHFVRNGISNMGRIMLSVKEFPEELLSFKEIKAVQLNFTDKIQIPDEFAKVKLKELDLWGEIDESGIERIKKLFPNAYILINNKHVNGEHPLKGLLPKEIKQIDTIKEEDLWENIRNTGF